MATISGSERLITSLGHINKLKQRQLCAGVHKAGSFLLRESLKIVPRDTGNLARTARCRITPESTPTRPVVTVSYGTGYAVYVHEIPDPPTAHGWNYNLKHRWEIATGVIEPFSKKPYRERGPNQQYKFLEKPLRENKQKLRDIIKTEVMKSG